jgi:single-strand DNA-binding protein
MSDLKMPEINNVIIAGNLTKDPVYRQTSNNTPVVNFSIASNRKYRDGSNQWQEDVCYVGVVAWNRLAESCRERLKKGSAVLVDGELQSRIWKTDEGYNRSVVEIKARRIQFLNKRVRYAQGENGQIVEVVEGINDVFVEDDHIEPIDFTEDTFDKFLSNEESDLIK